MMAKKKEVKEVKKTVVSISHTREDVTVTFSDGTKDIYFIKHYGSSRFISKRNE
jgi:ribosomal protein S11